MNRRSKLLLTIFGTFSLWIFASSFLKNIQAYVPEHLQILLSTRNCSRCELAGAPLTNANLSGGHLSNADLFGAILENTDLSNADLLAVNFGTALIKNCNLTGAFLNNSNLISANLINSNLSNSTLENANFSNANLTNVNFAGANLANANFSKANLKNTNFIADSNWNKTLNITAKQIKSACYWQEAKFDSSFLEQLKQEPDQKVDCSIWESSRTWQI